MRLLRTVDDYLFSLIGPPLAKPGSVMKSVSVSSVSWTASLAISLISALGFCSSRVDSWSLKFARRVRVGRSETGRSISRISSANVSGSWTSTCSIVMVVVSIEIGGKLVEVRVRKNGVI